MNDINTIAKNQEKIELQSELVMIRPEELKSLYRKLKDYEDQIQTYQEENSFLLNILISPTKLID